MSVLFLQHIKITEVEQSSLQFRQQKGKATLKTNKYYFKSKEHCNKILKHTMKPSVLIGSLTLPEINVKEKRRVLSTDLKVNRFSGPYMKR